MDISDRETDNSDKILFNQSIAEDALIGNTKSGSTELISSDIQKSGSSTENHDIFGYSPARLKSTITGLNALELLHLRFGHALVKN